MEFKNLTITKKNGSTILTISRPSALNALNTDVLNELGRAIDMIAVDETVNILVITGEGKAFVAGADIVEMKDMNTPRGREYGILGSSVFRKLELMEKPVIAAVNGYALGGGCELAMSCDIRIASEKAKFGQPEVSLGITPGFSGTQRLARIVGQARAKEIIFSGNMITAQEAAAIGLANRVVPHDLLMPETLALAEKIVSNAQLAVRYAKSAIDRGFESDIDVGIAIENNLFGLCFATEDQKEGMTAFVEKRSPKFTGN